MTGLSISPFGQKALVATIRLNAAGHIVRETDMPGLFDVDGIGRDLTLGQLIDVGMKYPPASQTTTLAT